MVAKSDSTRLTSNLKTRSKKNWSKCQEISTVLNSFAKIFAVVLYTSLTIPLKSRSINAQIQLSILVQSKAQFLSEIAKIAGLLWHALSLDLEICQTQSSICLLQIIHALRALRTYFSLLTTWLIHTWIDIAEVQVWISKRTIGILFMTSLKEMTVNQTMQLLIQVNGSWKLTHWKVSMRSHKKSSHIQ